MHLGPAQLFPFATTTTDVKLFLGPCLLRGWSLIETTGSAAS